MAVSADFTRPLATTTGTVSTSSVITTVEVDADNTFVIHLNATVGGNTKVVKRLKLALNISGATLTPVITALDFAGAAASYTGVSTPADSAATVTQTVQLNSVDLDAFYTAAGVARS